MKGINNHTEAGYVSTITAVFFNQKRPLNSWMQEVTTGMREKGINME